MQTFVPLEGSPEDPFSSSLLCLDYRRLGKQRVETKQILTALENQGGGWYNHPAVQMWSGCEAALAEYGRGCSQEWIKRGYVDNLLPWFQEPSRVSEVILPAWWGDQRVHSGHRANLIRKDPQHYGQFGWDETPVEGYFWPVAKAEVSR
jgi:hypothetical protein